MNLRDGSLLVIRSRRNFLSAKQAAMRRKKLKKDDESSHLLSGMKRSRQRLRKIDRIKHEPFKEEELMIGFSKKVNDKNSDVKS